MSSTTTRRDFIKTSTAVTLGLLVGCSLKNRFDIIIKNASILDGMGSLPVRKDIGINGDKISAIDNLQSATADVTIDASNLIVSPGFIDIHTHTDTELLVNPKAESKIHQGVTTEISGNCGYSPFPLNEYDFTELDKTLIEKYGFHLAWRDLPGFMKALDEKKISVNYATFTGHGKLRSFVVGKNDVQPTAEQLDSMKNLLAISMGNGSFGLSTGLEYAPGSYASTQELIELNKVVSRLNGVYATHMRNEDDRVVKAIQEAIQICREAEVSLQLSHLKVCNKGNWNKIDHMLALIHQAESRGLPVLADRYPYIAWSTGISSLLPLWSRQGTTDEVLSRLSDKQLLTKIQAYAEKRGKAIGGWDRFLINSCFTEENKVFEGKSIQQCASMIGGSPFDFVKKLMIEERNRVNIMGFAMDEDNLKSVLSSPLVMIGSDGSAVAPYGKLAEGKPHPRYYGTFPRVLGKYYRQEKLFDLTTAIKKMTSMPADKLGIRKRGRIAKDCFADIVIFDSESVTDNATFVEPHQYPTGIEYVFVNGKMTIKKGEHTGEYAGKVLRKS
jgi:N-acyl-D-amino-acid deacylase